MMKILKFTGIALSIMAAIVILGLVALAINNKAQMKKEAMEFTPPGSMVEVNGKKLHVYTEEEGDATLVFMAGHGTSYPTLDFKPLWTKLTDNYRIAVVEKSGYGWSGETGDTKEIDSMLDETRKALESAGEEGPYVLVPHSMSGLEAIRWAQKYPEEVIAVIGLDPYVPKAYDTLQIPGGIQLKIMRLISKIGLARLMPDEEAGKQIPILESDELTEDEKREYMAVFYKSTMTKDMVNEVGFLKENTETVLEHETPANTPMLFFISTGQESAAAGWGQALVDYLSGINVSKHVQLDTGHYVHYEKADTIAEGIKAFLDGIE